MATLRTIEDLAKVVDVPVVIANDKGLITQVNEVFHTIFGWERDEIVGQTLTTIIPKNLRDAHHMGFSRFLTTGKATLLNQPLKLRAVKKNGKEFDAEHFIIAEKRDNQWILGATIRPLD